MRHRSEAEAKRCNMPSVAADPTDTIEAALGDAAATFGDLSTYTNCQKLADCLDECLDAGRASWEPSRLAKPKPLVGNRQGSLSQGFGSYARQGDFVEEDLCFLKFVGELFGVPMLKQMVTKDTDLLPASELSKLSSKDRATVKEAAEQMAKLETFEQVQARMEASDNAKSEVGVRVLKAMPFRQGASGKPEVAEFERRMIKANKALTLYFRIVQGSKQTRATSVLLHCEQYWGTPFTTAQWW